jgi:hypothetical protein
LKTLKPLRAAEAELAKASDQAMEAELRALLEAEPGKLPQMNSGERLNRLAAEYGRAEQEAWKKLDGGIGKPKADVLRRLLGRFGFGFAPMPGGMQPGGPPRGHEEGGPPIELQVHSIDPGAPDVELMPHQGGGQSGPPRAFVPGPQFGPPVMLSLEDLVRLLEQKLAAMRR